MFVTDFTEAANIIDRAHCIAFLGNGGNLAIAQHASSDMSRHTTKFCFAPGTVHLTALGGDGDWREPWIDYAGRIADLIIGITTRVDSPIAKSLEHADCEVLLLCPQKHPKIPTLEIIASTFHEFEVRALWSMYMIMQQNGAQLPTI